MSNSSRLAEHSTAKASLHAGLGGKHPKPDALAVTSLNRLHFATRARGNQAKGIRAVDISQHQVRHLDCLRPRSVNHIHLRKIGHLNGAREFFDRSRQGTVPDFQGRDGFAFRPGGRGLDRRRRLSKQRRARGGAAKDRNSEPDAEVTVIFISEFVGGIATLLEKRRSVGNPTYFLQRRFVLLGGQRQIRSAATSERCSASADVAFPLISAKCLHH